MAINGVIIFFPFIVIFKGFGQNSNYIPKFWRLMHIGGEVELYGQYSELYSSSSIADNKETNFLFSGKLTLLVKRLRLVKINT